MIIKSNLMSVIHPYKTILPGQSLPLTNTTLISLRKGYIFRLVLKGVWSLNKSLVLCPYKEITNVPALLNLQALLEQKTPFFFQ